jgi:site-specific DNA recombinase
MLAATYARYSSDKQRENSIKDQLRNCETYVERENWQIVERFEDQAISGARNDRPGHQAMLAAAEERRFEVLVIDDLSRLSRDDIEIKQVIRRFKLWGIRIIGVSDGFDSESKGHKIQAGMRGMMNEIYLDDLREQTHRGLTGQALQGYNTGGRCYGYRHVPIEDSTKKDEFNRPRIIAVKREIESEQAKWVRQIFQWYADGHPPRWIAAELNRLGVPALRGGTWAGNGIHGDTRKGTGLLNNQLYIGRYVWNRSQWILNPDTGRKKRIPRPESEWIEFGLPDLRIVSQELWDRVKVRQQQVHEASGNIRKALHENARTGAGPKYLFSGLLKCGQCGANYVIADKHRYGCSKQINRGPNVCNNAIKVPRRLVEERLLGGINTNKH